MHNHEHCPNCDSRATEVQDTQFYTDAVERVRVCLDCPTQYVVEYGRPEIVSEQTVDQ